MSWVVITDDGTEVYETEEELDAALEAWIDAHWCGEEVDND